MHKLLFIAAIHVRLDSTKLGYSSLQKLHIKLNQFGQLLHDSKENLLQLVSTIDCNGLPQNLGPRNDNLCVTEVQVPEEAVI